MDMTWIFPRESDDPPGQLLQHFRIAIQSAHTGKVNTDSDTNRVMGGSERVSPIKLE